MDGLEVCRRLRAQPSTKALPIIILTAATIPVTFATGCSLAPDDFLTKADSTRQTSSSSSKRFTRG